MKLLLVGMLVVAPLAMNGAIIAGDVALVRVNSDIDGFSVLALRDLSASETLYATDRGWLATGGFNSGEGIGTTDLITQDILRGTVFDVSFSNLAQAGDQVFLFTGTVSLPTLVFGIDWDNIVGWDADATDANSSADPAVAPVGSPALTDRLTVSLGDNHSYRYNGIMMGTPDELLNAIGNAANWTTTSDTSWSAGSFAIVPEPEECTLFSAFGLLAIAGIHSWQQRRKAVAQAA